MTLRPTGPYTKTRDGNGHGSGQQLVGNDGTEQDSDIGAARVGLTPARCQSGELDRGLGISEDGESGVRWAVAGIVMRQTTKSLALKVWGMTLAKRRGRAKALVVMALHLAMILHEMWIDSSEYRWPAQPG